MKSATFDAEAEAAFAIWISKSAESLRRLGVADPRSNRALRAAFFAGGAFGLQVAGRLVSDKTT